MLDQITPVILTYNEAPNLDRTLQQLSWAQRIVIVDSYSTDTTLEIAAQYPQVELLQRQFDTHAQQWNYAVAQAQTEWVLSLDADYCVSDALFAEMQSLSPAAPYDSYWIPFKFCIFGRPLRGAILPPREALFRKSKAVYIDDGHTQLLQSTGHTGELKAPINHDDRKSLDRWLWAQARYANLEVDKLMTMPASELGLNDRIRQAKVVAPFVVLVYCLILRGGIFDGWQGWFYAFQRMIAEMILSARLIEAAFKQKSAPVVNLVTS
ncbi:glycosyltransferase family 2 protein [filamentous cyanobacterium LEGE 11480]|uniref:Glycosyltransferase family 2 protein n=1 Tax=Romeriopsis navalis LEGE 11480 TaxID=2777977 RepID=A0A928Z403_9CYAN|nr:glycosyltransferase family 2 protein [Romeriopsis navalis]MBE9029823.1 glycosyltransferase family 2 protein [Romeriopsis navalis LEGE 11480]